MIKTLDSTDQSDALAQVYGTVLQIGSLSFRDLSGTNVEYQSPFQGKVATITEKIGAHWCEVGDMILFHPYSYQRVRCPITMDFRHDMVVVNDQDVIAVVTDLERYKAEYSRLKEEEATRLKQMAAKRQSRY